MRYPTSTDENTLLTRIVDGEISPNVEQSPNHDTNSFSIAGAGQLDLRLRVGREGGRDLHRNEEVAGENVFVEVTDRRSKP